MINIEDIRMYCLQKDNVTEGFPFGDEVLVFKVSDKLFLLTNLESDTLRINLKALPEKVTEYLELYPAAIPAYHMNKKHWFTLQVDGSLSDQLVYEMIDDSYNLVVAKLPKKRKNRD